MAKTIRIAVNLDVLSAKRAADEYKDKLHELEKATADVDKQTVAYGKTTESSISSAIARYATLTAAIGAALKVLRTLSDEQNRQDRMAREGAITIQQAIIKSGDWKIRDQVMENLASLGPSIGPATAASLYAGVSSMMPGASLKDRMDIMSRTAHAAQIEYDPQQLGPLAAALADSGVPGPLAVDYAAMLIQVSGGTITAEDARSLKRFVQSGIGDAKQGLLFLAAGAKSRTGSRVLNQLIETVGKKYTRADFSGLGAAERQFAMAKPADRLNMLLTDPNMREAMGMTVAMRTLMAELTPALEKSLAEAKGLISRQTTEVLADPKWNRLQELRRLQNTAEWTVLNRGTLTGPEAVAATDASLDIEEPGGWNGVKRFLWEKAKSWGLGPAIAQDNLKAGTDELDRQPGAVTINVNTAYGLTPGAVANNKVTRGQAPVPAEK